MPLRTRTKKRTLRSAPRCHRRHRRPAAFYCGAGLALVLSGCSNPYKSPQALFRHCKTVASAKRPATCSSARSRQLALELDQAARRAKACLERLEGPDRLQVVGPEQMEKNLQQSRLVRVRITGDRAEGELRISGWDKPVPIHFVREQGQWKIDHSELYTRGIAAARRLCPGDR